MTRINTKTSFVLGIAAGCLITILAMILWLMPSVSYEKHGELIFRDYPKGINTVSFRNDLVVVAVTDLAFDRDVPFEINFIAECQDSKFGSIWGNPHRGQFFFEYKNRIQGIYDSPPINDVNGSHPSTLIKKAQQ